MERSGGVIEPKDVDLSDKLQKVFGCFEVEDAACRILRFLADNSKVIPGHPSLGSGHAPDFTPILGWDKSFRIDTIPGISPTMFAMLCAAGWIVNTWFPKGTFRVSDAFKERIDCCKRRMA